MIALDSHFNFGKKIETHKATNMESVEPVEAWECIFRQKFKNRRQCRVCGSVVIIKLEESNLLQFPFELKSHSFSDNSRLQDNIFYLLWHQVAQILYELPHENRKKSDDYCLWFSHASFLLSCSLWRVQFLALPLSFGVVFGKLSSPITTRLR
jgi:hypothetical protein